MELCRIEFFFNHLAHCFGNWFMLLHVSVVRSFWLHIRIYQNMFAHLPTDGHLGCFQFGSIKNKSAKKNVWTSPYVDIWFGNHEIKSLIGSSQTNTMERWQLFKRMLVRWSGGGNLRRKGILMFFPFYVK